jgi:hypothetical protein
MNWKAIFIWVFLGLVVWFTGSLGLGLVFGVRNIPEGGDWMRSALAGMLVPFLAFMVYQPAIFVILLLAALIWISIVKRFPRIETDRRNFPITLSLYALLIGALVWLFYPLDRSLAGTAMLLTALSLLLPRVACRRLSAGVFAP